jgi:hypothetical protein
VSFFGPAARIVPSLSCLVVTSTAFEFEALAGVLLAAVVLVSVLAVGAGAEAALLLDDELLLPQPASSTSITAVQLRVSACFTMTSRSLVIGDPDGRFHLAGRCHPHPIPSRRR